MLAEPVAEGDKQAYGQDRSAASRNDCLLPVGEDMPAAKCPSRLVRAIGITKAAPTRGRALRFALSEAFYRFAKAAYWSLPATLQAKLQFVRWELASRRLTRLAAIPAAKNSHAFSSSLPPWVEAGNRAERIAIIPCGFEFDQFVNQRPVNAARYFASQGYFVIFVAWQWSPQERLSKGASQVFPGIFQVPLFDFLSAASQLIHREDSGSLYLATLPAPPLVEIARLLRSRGITIVYDIMDEWEAFSRVGQAPWYDRQLERSLVLESDHVTAVSPPLAKKFSGLRRDIVVVGNGYSPAVVGEASAGIAIRTGKPDLAVGYFGHLADAWFDWELLFHAAARLAHIRFEIIGYGEPAWARERIFEVPNVWLIGKVQPLELQKFAGQWSATLIPFRRGSLAEAVDPIKIYEYLFFGLPVVATGIRHIDRYPHTRFADGEDEFVAAIREALQVAVDAGELESFLAETTWTRRFGQISKLLEANSLGKLYAH
jgi:glycosyltransferase involved in cell wall biosynthesis